MRNLNYKKLWNEILDMIFPSNIHCIICNEPIDIDEKYGLCQICSPKIKWINSNSEIFHNKFFVKLRTCVFYDDSIKKLVADLKYNKKPYVSIPMAEMMYEATKDIVEEIDCIVPVPLHKTKIKERGYNQASLLAKELSVYLSKKVWYKTLFRKAETPPQNNLSFLERMINQANAFQVNPKGLKNKRILLVDDIYTTGSTVDSCAQVLLEEGAQSVIVCTFAKAEQKNKD